MSNATIELISVIFCTTLIIGFLITMRAAFRDADRRRAERKGEVMAKSSQQAEIENR